MVNVGWLDSFLRPVTIRSGRTTPTPIHRGLKSGSYSSSMCKVWKGLHRVEQATHASQLSLQRGLWDVVLMAPHSMGCQPSHLHPKLAVGGQMKEGVVFILKNAFLFGGSEPFHFHLIGRKLLARPHPAARGAGNCSAPPECTAAPDTSRCGALLGS